MGRSFSCKSFIAIVMDKIKRFISIIIQGLLTLSILLAVLCVFAKCIAFNQLTYTNIFNKNNVYTHIKDIVYEKIDSTLKAKNIDYDIKEDILTEDDIRREVDNTIQGTIEYLETSENDVKPIDSEIYKQRAADILHHTVDSIIKPDNTNLSLNDDLNIQRTSYSVKNSKLYERTNFDQSGFKVEKLMSKEEAEAKVRDLLKQKGLTEEQAIKKAKEKGITEEQALKILAAYGITIDGLTDGDDSKNQEEGSDKNQGNNRETANSQNSSEGKNSSVYENDNKQTGNSQAENNSDTIYSDKLEKAKLSELENKLLDEAANSIDKEVEKIDVSKILDSEKIKAFTKVTAMIYKLFWLIIIVPMVLMFILLLSGHPFKYSIKRIGGAFISSGLIMFLVFGFGYFSRVYEKINITPDYFKDIVFCVISYFMKFLSISGIGIFVIGLLVMIPTIGNAKRKAKGY